MKKKYPLWLLIIMLCMLGLSGCSSVKESTKESLSASKSKIPVETVEKWKEYGYVKLEWEKPEFTYDSVTEIFGYSDEKSYAFRTYDIGNSQRYFLEKYNQLTEKNELKELYVKESEQISGQIVYADVQQDEKIWLLFAETEGIDGEVIQYESLELDSEGKVHNRTPISQEDIAREGMVIPAFYGVDENGYIFILNPDKTKLFVFDAGGKLSAIKEYDNPMQVGIRGGRHSADNRLCFAMGDMESGTGGIYQYTVGKEDFTEFAPLEHWAVEDFLITEDNCIYYIMDEQLIKWDREADTKEVLFSFLASTIPVSAIQAIEWTAEGDILLHVSEATKREIYILSKKEKEVTESGLRIASLTVYTDNYVESCAAGFSRENPDTIIEFNTAPAGYREDYFNQIMAEMVAGDGPDLLWVFREDMEILYEKGLLQDLTVLLSEETREQIFPGIIKAGSIGEEYIGLASDAMPDILMTSNALWESEHWDFEEFFGVLSENQPCGIFTDYGSNSGFNIKLNLIHSLLRNLPYSSYIDEETGKSYLNGKEFKSALEAIKLYSGKTPYKWEKNAVMEGGYIAQYCCVANYEFFSEMMYDYGETCHLVGFPGQTDGVGYWSADSFLVVNKKSQKQEEIGRFLEYLLEAENQKNVVFNSVREDVVRENIMSELDQTYMTEILGIEENFYLEEYIRCLKNCGAPPRAYQDISNIIQEEAAAYFEEDRNLDEIADIIHNRVQLYLDEN